MDIKQKALEAKADFIRQEVIRVAIKNKAGHIAPSLSCVDILVALYYDIMNENDRLIFSKAHGGYGLYAILADKGIIPKERWENFDLPGCVERMPEYGIEAGCGALGHGLPMAVGLAYGNKLQGKEGRIFCLCGDGELQEGTTWESVQFALHHKLNNLTLIVDDNGLQAMDFTENILDVDLCYALTGLEIYPLFCAGHDIAELSEIITQKKAEKEEHQPTFIFAATVKGYGLKCAENVPKFHYRVPKENELSQGNN